MAIDFARRCAYVYRSDLGHTRHYTTGWRKGDMMQRNRWVAGVVLLGLLAVLLAPQAALAKDRVVELYIPSCG
jgi:hypothetical protein